MPKTTDLPAFMGDLSTADLINFVDFSENTSYKLKLEQFLNYIFLGTDTWAWSNLGDSISLDHNGNDTTIRFDTDGSALFSNIKSGSYTPTISNAVNIDSSTFYVSNYMRVGSVVTVSLKITVNMTASVWTEFQLNTPFPGTFTAEEEASGSFWADSTTTNIGAGIKAVPATNNILVFFRSPTSGTLNFFGSFTYKIIS